jgi:hypothetical protein
MKEFQEVCQKQPVKANPLAPVSLVLGVVAVPVGVYGMVEGNVFWWLVAVGAVICGHVAMRKISRCYGKVRGYGMARTGLWLGYIVLLGFPVFMALAIPVTSRISKRGDITQGISNCRQIITTLRLYSSDCGGNYPDTQVASVKTSNDAFRLLFIGGEADDEKIFGCPKSVFQPDGNIGKEPNYLEAVKPGENHWAMTRGLNDSASGTYPLVFENPSEATWPPKWNPSFVGTGKPGRTWTGGKIIIGMNDSSVALQKCESDQGRSVSLAPCGHDAAGKPVNLFSQNGPMMVLDVAK